MIDEPEQLEWWGEYCVSDGETFEWTIGPLQLVIGRDGPDLWIASKRDDYPLRADLRVAKPADQGVFKSLAAERFGFNHADVRLQLRPRLADRPVVVRTEHPLSILPGEDITLYVSTPIWVEVLFETPPVSLMELPAFPPSDTWFGPLAGDGELCYAGKTLARRRYDTLRSWPHRAATRIEIQNQASDVFRVESLKLPVPTLELFAPAQGRMETDTVQLTRLSRRDAQITKKRTSGPEGNPPSSFKELSPPRVAEPSSGALTFLSHLFN